MKRFIVLSFFLIITAMAHTQPLTLAICPAGLEFKENATLMTFEKTGDQFYVYSDTILTESDVVATRIANHLDRNVLILEFNPEKKKVIRDATTAYRGLYLAVVVNNKLISAPRISAPLEREILLIDGMFTADEAIDYLQRFMGILE